ncbi:MAG: hypothetical protein ACJAXB_000923 [Candidatus Endobugula sp.]|jgi:hypothetical protein
MKDIMIKKYSGDLVPFDPSKLKGSLFRSGASRALISTILYEVDGCLYDGISTKEIYKKAFNLLKKASNTTASRYQLKKAIMELGPSGYPFESFIGHLFEYQGYKVETGVVLQGKCVTHEVDVRAENDAELHFMECKYHSKPNFKLDVKIALYVHSRFNDLAAHYQSQYPSKKLTGWLVVNTSLTSDAIQYAACSGMKTMSWASPEKGSLKERIEISGLYPISCLLSLSKTEKQVLLNEDIVLCRQLIDSPKAIEFIDQRKRKKVLKECEILSKPFAV